MRKVILLSIVCIICNVSYSQNSNQYIVPNGTCNCKVFAIRDSIVQTQSFALQNIENKDYFIVMSQIDSLNRIEKHIQNEKLILKDSLRKNLLKFDSQLFEKSTILQLQNAKKYLKNGIEQHNSSSVLNRNTNNILGVIKLGNDYLKQSKISYKEDNTGLYTIRY